VRYEPIPKWTASEIEAILVQNRPDEVCLAALSAALYADDSLWAEAICLRLAQHPNAAVRGNAILGFGHIARLHQHLTRTLTQPVIERALQDENNYVRSQAENAADDVNVFLKWELKRPRI
jgi:hypothetical protein